MDGMGSFVAVAIMLAILGGLWIAIRLVVARSSPTLRRRNQRYPADDGTGAGAGAGSHGDGGHHHSGLADHAGDGGGHGGDAGGDGGGDGGH